MDLTRARTQNLIGEGDTPLLVRSIQGGGGLGRTQYAKGQYAVRNYSVKSYAALKKIIILVFRNYSRKYHTAIENARLADK